MNENILLLDLLLQLIHALYVFLKNRLIERGVFRSNSLHSIGYLNALTRDWNQIQCIILITAQ